MLYVFLTDCMWKGIVKVLNTKVVIAIVSHLDDQQHPHHIVAVSDARYSQAYKQIPWQPGGFLGES